MTCTCNNNSDHTGFVSGLALGLVFGAAGAYYLNNTDQGRELLEKLKEKAGEALEDVKDNPALAEKIAELQKTMDAARATINTAAEKVVSATEPPSHHSPSTTKKSFFQKMGVSLGK